MVTAGSPRVQQREALAATRRLAARWPEWLCLAFYAAVQAVMIPYHEPWADEAQAWMLARSLSPWQLVHTFLRYEGQPGLWHLFLWVLVHLHVSYAGMHWICGLLGCCGIYVLLFYSPFPRWLKMTAPFTLFLAYQYTVVARNYVLIPLLLFAVAAVWKRSPLLVALLLGLLANVAAHAAAIAAGFAIAYWFDRRASAKPGEATPPASAFRWAGVIFFALCVAAVLTAFPTKDVYTAATPGARTHAVMALGALVWAMWDPMPLSLVGWGILIWGFSRRRALHLLIPAGALVLFSAAVYLSFWHAGLTVPVLIAALWLSWPAPGASLAVAEKAMRVAIALLIATQIGWAVHAAWYDHFHDYSPDKRTAEFLQPYVEAGSQIAVTYVRDRVVRSFHLVGIEPYFRGKIFMNQPYPFWWWSRHDTTEADFPRALSLHPQFVVAEAEVYEATTAGEAGNLADPEVAARVASIESQGYQLERNFCAIKPERFSYRESLCYLVFMRKDPEQGGPPAALPQLPSGR